MENVQIPQTTIDPNNQKFIDFVKQECLDHKVKLTLSPNDHVISGSTKCNGFFDNERMELAVACGKSFDIWFKTLIHEYCHMVQWMTNRSAWIRADLQLAHPEALIDLWYSKKIELTAKQLDYWLPLAFNVELDCERLVLTMVDKFKLPIDKKRYAQNGNAYVYFWMYLKHRRKWYKIGKEPYNILEITSKMPTDFDRTYKKLPLKYKKLFDKHIGLK
jgi:hypothetical protein